MKQKESTDEIRSKIIEKIHRNEDAIDYLQTYPHYEDSWETQSKINYHKARIETLKRRLGDLK